MHSIRIIGPGRAGTSLAAALSARGWAFAGFLGRHDELARAAEGVDLLVIATPDDAVAEVAAAVVPSPGTTVAHLSGSLGLDALAPHPLRAAVHPLVPLPNGEVGAARLGSGVTFAVAGAPLGRDMVTSLGGRMVEVADDDRAAYHAAACIAANHVVALLGQVERVAASVGLDLESFLPLTRAAVDDVAALGAGAALTGPARRGDWATLSRHLDALPESERAGYQAGAALATRLAQAEAPVPSRRPPPCRRSRPSQCRRSRRRCRGSDGGGRRVRRRLPRPAGPGPCRRPGGRAGAHHGRAARRAHVADGPGPRRMRRGGGQHLREPAAVRRPRGHRALPEDAGARPARCARESGADVVFVPSVDEMYPSWPDAPSTTVSVRGVSDAWEGASRPGHFDGVATVVAKLFTIGRALPGLLRLEGLPAAGRRPAHGASSSRCPSRWSGAPSSASPTAWPCRAATSGCRPTEREAATVLSRALAAGRAALADGERSGARRRPGDARRGRRRAAGAARLRRRGRRRHPRGGGRPSPATRPDGSLRLLIAAQVGPVRLIDNSRRRRPRPTTSAPYPWPPQKVRQLERIG